MGRVVSCRECESEVELPDVPKPGKVYRCPDCREPLPLPKSRPPANEEPVRRPKPRVVEDEDERPAKRPKPREEEDDDEPPPRKKKKRKSRPEPEAKPFWNTKQGRILSGLGMLLLGGVAIAAVVIFDSSKPLKGYIAGGVCILFGLGGIVSGVVSSDDDGGDDGD